MANDSSRAEDLREAARNRGLHLVKSRRRKAGVGDFGKFGLADANGEKIFGFAAEGLTADAEDIERYLRSSENDTWRSSAALPQSSSRSDNASRDRGKSPLPDQDHERPTAREKKNRPSPDKQKILRKPAPSPPPIKPPVPLKIRAARRKDWPDIVALLTKSHLVAESDKLEQRLASLKTPNHGIIVADQEGLKGVAAWSVLPTVQHGPTGRISVIAVEEKSRRRGIGRALLDATVVELAKAGCILIEVMSDIEIRNAHGFFRSTGFEQKSYRFVKRPEAD